MTGKPEGTYLTTEQAAQYLCVSKSTLENWRWLRGGPPYIKLGHLVRYKVEDLEAWAAENRRAG